MRNCPLSESPSWAGAVASVGLLAVLCAVGAVEVLRCWLGGSARPIMALRNVIKYHYYIRDSPKRLKDEPYYLVKY